LTFLRKLIQPSYKAGYAKSASESAHPNLWDGLVGAWVPAFGSTGNVLRDIINRHDAATLNNNASWVTSDQGIGVELDGDRDTVTLGSLNDIKGVSQLSVMVLAKQTIDNDEYSAYIHDENGSTKRWGLSSPGSAFGGNTNVIALMGNGANSYGYTSSGNATFGEWNHVGFVFDGNGAGNAERLKIFINGYEESVSYGGTIPALTHNLASTAYLGRYANQQELPGIFHSVLIWNRAITAGDVQQLYADPLAPFKQKSIRIFGGVGIPTDTSKIITVKRNKSDVKPSYKSGYAQSAGESAHPNLWDGLVGAWMPSMGVTGGILRDVSGNENHGTLTNMDPATDWVTTSKGLALDFDGSDDFVSLPVDVLPLTIGFSVSFWIYASVSDVPNNSADGIYDSTDDWNTTGGGMWITIDDRAGARSVDGISIQWDTDLGPEYAQASNLFGPTKEWHCVSCVYRGTSSSIYHNGVDRTSAASSVNNSPYRPDIGEQPVIGKAKFAGTNSSAVFGNFLIHNRALSPLEIKQLYADPLAPFRKKQQIAFNAYPLTLLEKIRSVAKPTTTRAISVKKNSVPSYKSGYAKSASESANPKLWDGLVGAWMPSLGVTGDTLRDVSGNGNHGTLTNMDSATDWVTTSKGLALDFDGVNDYVESQDSIDAMGSSPRTLSSSFEIRSTANQTIAGFGNPSASQWFYILIFQQKWYFSGYANDFSIATPLPTLGKHHIAVSYDSSDVRFYLDNLLIAQFAKTLNTQAGVLRIGLRAGFNDFPLNGQVDSVYFHNRALSPQEIKQLYVDSLAPFRKKTLTVGYQPSKELRGLFRT
jgi:hypothetical protein